MESFLKLLPFRDYLYAALAVAGVVLWFHHNHEEQVKGAAREAAAVVTASLKAERDAQTTIDKLNATYTADSARLKDTYEKTMQADDAAYAADVQRLRDRAARDRKAYEMLGRAAGGSASGNAGASGDSGLGSVPSEQALKLSAALRADDAALIKCYADRDSLTGK